MFRHTASIIKNPSTARTSPAPRELHTLNRSVFNNANFSFVTCEYLHTPKLGTCAIECGRASVGGEMYHPYAKSPQWRPCQRICQSSLRPVNSRLYHGSSSGIVVLDFSCRLTKRCLN